jgi:hemerythrin-like metal-binding domain
MEVRVTMRGFRDGEMGGLQWSESMSVGIPALDADHRCLVRIISLLEDVREETAGQIIDMVLDTLAVYCRYHFAREEQVMAGSGFPALSFHQSEHEGFARMVRRLRERHAVQSDAAMAQELLDFLTGWLCHHILIQDMAYKPFAVEHWRGPILPELPALSQDFGMPAKLV